VTCGRRAGLVAAEGLRDGAERGGNFLLGSTVTSQVAGHSSTPYMASLHPANARAAASHATRYDMQYTRLYTSPNPLFPAAGVASPAHRQSPSRPCSNHHERALYRRDVTMGPGSLRQTSNELNRCRNKTWAGCTKYRHTLTSPARLTTTQSPAPLLWGGPPPPPPLPARQRPRSSRPSAMPPVISLLRGVGRPAGRPEDGRQSLGPAAPSGHQRPPRAGGPAE
jgi:hypothetical protein